MSGHSDTVRRLIIYTVWGNIYCMPDMGLIIYTLYQMSGHSDTVTGLSLSPDGNLLLSNAMDNTLRVWDTRAFVEGQVCVPNVYLTCT